MLLFLLRTSQHQHDKQYIASNHGLLSIFFAMMHAVLRYVAACKCDTCKQHTRVKLAFRLPEYEAMHVAGYVQTPVLGFHMDARLDDHT